jgi:hypothetical protein
MVWSNKRWAFGFAAGFFLVGKGAWAQDLPATLPAGWLETQSNERGQNCDQRAVRASESTLLVACGAAGVWEIAMGESGARFVKSHEFPGDAVGFLVEPDGSLWVKLQVLEARRFSPGAAGGVGTFPSDAPVATPLPPAAVVVPKPGAKKPDPEPEGPPVRSEGRVTRVAPGEVVISLGSDDNVDRGDRIELALERANADDAELGEEAVLAHETLAVGVVTNVSARSAKIRLGMNESVPLGAVATPTRAATTASLVSPPRVTGIWDAEFMLRPFAAVGELGGGFLLSAAISRRYGGHFQLRAVLDPWALGDAERSESVHAVNAAVIASYDSQYFEMGLGLGAQTVNESEFFLESGTGLSAAQLIRLGPQDGLNLTARTSVVLFHSEFAFGGMVAAAQIPITHGYWLLFAGGGGNVGYAYGELGLRVLLAGDGLAGSRFLNVSAGGAGVFRSAFCAAFEPCGQSVSYAGPMAGIGSEWRF